MQKFALIFLLAAGPALADDADALSLADKAPTTIARASDWRISADAGYGITSQRYGAPSMHGQRLSLDVQFDKTIATGWRAVFADRIDATWQDQPRDRNTVNTLKEAYLSWQPSSNQILDLGRINVRNGVASGYNPTDFFRAGALRSVVSIDPASLKKNRLGSVMLRGQTLWDSGSLTALYSPKLATNRNDAPFNPDLAATNNRNRWLIAASQKFSDSFNPQWLLYGEENQSPQLGMNLTHSVNDATVAYLEWSGGRSRSLISQALNRADDSAFRTRLASGLTYTTANNMSFAIEYDYNGAALDKNDWESLGRGSPLVYAQYRRWVQNLQEPPTKQSIFLYATWQDAMINHLDLTGMLRFNLSDNSRISWLEARYHWSRADLSLQWQQYSGRPGSEYGALPQQRIIQAVMTYYF